LVNVLDKQWRHVRLRLVFSFGFSSCGNCTWGTAYSEVKVETKGRTFTRKSSAWKRKARPVAVSQAAWHDVLESIGNRIFAGMEFKV